MFMFRADGNSQIGSGHIMRCLSIADAGRRDAGQDSLFVLAGDEFKEIIEDRGFRCEILQGDYREMEPETGKMEELIRRYVPSALFVDSYYVTASYLEALKDFMEREKGRLVYVDDVMAFAHPCHVLVNYNIYGPGQRGVYEELYREAKVAVPELLLGTVYVPLREDFQGLAARRVRLGAEDILISSGGADTEHIGLSLVRYLRETKGLPEGERFDGFRFHFVIGAMNRDLEEIKKAAAGDERIFLHVQVRDMQGLMSRCDVALSAAGATLYELCAAQTPAVTYILADNQTPGAEGFEEYRVLPCAGDVRHMGERETAERLMGAVVKLAKDHGRREKMAARQRMLVDGKGAGRIAMAAAENR